MCLFESGHDGVTAPKHLLQSYGYQVLSLAGKAVLMSSKSKNKRVAEWATKWNSHVINFLMRIGASNSDAQDFAQEVYLRLLRYEDLSIVRNPRAYLFTIAENLLSEWQIRHAQSKPHASDILDLLSSDDKPDQDAVQAELQQTIRNALSKLTPITRQVILLHVVEGLTCLEVSERLNISPRMVKRHILRGYSQLRRKSSLGLANE